MTTKERLHKMVDELSEQEAQHARIVVEQGPGYPGKEPEMVGVPESWRTFDDGTPQPNWVALLDEVRHGR